MRISDWSSDVCSSDLRGDEVTDADAENGDRRKHGDRQRIAEGDTPFRKAEGARPTDVALAQHFKHRGAHHPGDVPDPAAADGNGRQHQMPDLAADVALPAGAVRSQQRRVGKEWGRKGVYRWLQISSKK